MNHSIRVKVYEQRLYLYYGNKLLKTYSVSTFKYGIGNKSGSNKTPLGLHRIVNKIGWKAPLGAIFVKRRNSDNIYKARHASDDLITTRILRLEGLERGINKGRGIDSFKRCIYIHGTSQERLIGKPASHGCIRMKNRDIMELFDMAKRGVLVRIYK